MSTVTSSAPLEPKTAWPRAALDQLLRGLRAIADEEAGAGAPQ